MEKAQAGGVKLTVSEEKFSETVIEYAQFRGYRVVHFRPARTNKGWRTPVAADGEGWPDLTLVGRGRIVFAELKSETGRLSERQREWIEALEAAGQGSSRLEAVVVA